MIGVRVARGQLGVGPRAQLRVDLPGPAFGLPVRTSGLVVVVQIGRVHHHGEPLHLAYLAQFEGGEPGPGRAAAADHRHHPRGGGAETLADVVGDVGVGQLLGGPHEHARHVQGHVAHAHHGRAFSGQVPVRRHVGVAVVPGHELRRAVGAGQLLAGDPQLPVCQGSGCEDHRVVVRAQVLEGDVRAEVHVAQEADAGVLADLPEGAGDALDPRVVGGDPVPQEAVGDGQRVEEIHDDLAAALVGPVQQGLAGVDAGGAGAHHGDADRRR